jgi:sugar phosphate isomerase/epimerase
MALILGILGDSYRRQLRHLDGSPAIEVLLDKVTTLIEKFHIQPIGLDFSVGQLASTDPPYLEALKKRLQSLHIVPTVIVGSLVLHADHELADPPLEEAIRNLSVAHYLGSPLGLYYFSYGGRVTHEGRIRLATEQVARLAKAAQQYNLYVTTENYDYFTSDDFLEIFTKAGQTNVGLHNDTGNWLLLGEDPLTATRKMAPYTYHAHVRDYDLRDGVYSSVPIGKGQVDFPPILAELQQISAQRERLVLSIEMDLDEGDEDGSVEQCVRYMTDWFAQQSDGR